MFLLVCLSSIAVPGFNGFVGEFLILVGSWKFSKTLVVVASLGVILAAAYMLWMVQRVFYGEVTNPKNEALPDLSMREWVVVAPLVGLALFMGVASPSFTRYIEPSVDRLVIQLQQRTKVGVPARDWAAAKGPTPTTPASPTPAPEGSRR